MCKNKDNRHKNEKGIALITTLLLVLLLSILVGGLLASSSSDVLITGNDIRNNAAFYVAESGIHRASGWFSARFGADPNSGLYVLPAQMNSNIAGSTTQFSYTTPTPTFKKG